MANKVRFGLRKLYRAKVNRAEDGTVTFGTPIAVPGAQQMTATPEGSEPQKIYADDGVYYTIEGTNGGYTVDVTVVHLSDSDRADLLGETLDAATGVQFESTDDRAPEYAWIMEMQGDFNPTAFCFYCGKARRITVNANTKGDAANLDTDTISIDFTSVPLPFHGEVKNFIQGHIEKSADNAEKYAQFFQSVVVPTSEAPASA